MNIKSQNVDANHRNYLFSNYYVQIENPNFVCFPIKIGNLIQSYQNLFTNFRCSDQRNFDDLAFDAASFFRDKR